MRISDWSSDVCSSDLPKQFGIVMGEADIGDAGGKKARAAAACFDPCLRLLRAEAAQSLVGKRVEQGFLVGEIAIEDRKRGGKGKSVSVSLHIGGRCSIKKKNTEIYLVTYCI